MDVRRLCLGRSSIPDFSERIHAGLLRPGDGNYTQEECSLLGHSLVPAHGPYDLDGGTKRGAARHFRIPTPAPSHRPPVGVEHATVHFGSHRYRRSIGIGGLLHRVSVGLACGTDRRGFARSRLCARPFSEARIGSLAQESRVIYCVSLSGFAVGDGCEGLCSASQVYHSCRANPLKLRGRCLAVHLLAARSLCETNSSCNVARSLVRKCSGKNRRSEQASTAASS